MPEQRATAVYVNRWGQAVIRQERAWDDEADTFVIVDHAHLPDVIQALRDIADVEPARDMEEPPRDMEEPPRIMAPEATLQPESPA
ncbi:hypothetical protein [Bradyrhizobium canariense]|uniref:hypothetical protein n=1 Tax=Bradyrhizobium canariense TaxID=255045 RepID=UPI0019583AC3|nr:hypothetical protein [Bradyrhizobium canariense]MBM7483340.1 hypothetical protein [Bradyrhizobium canariense]